MGRDESIPKRSSSASFRRRQRIGKILHDCRVVAGLNIQDAAKKAGVSFYQWQRMEMGYTAIPIERVVDIAKAVPAFADAMADDFMKAAA